jgi:hypothetical protein
MRRMSRLAIAVLLVAPVVTVAASDATVPTSSAASPPEMDVTTFPMPQSEGQLIVRSGQPEPSGPFPVPRSVTELDSNGDGVIDRSEARANLALWNEFDLADNRDPANRDGHVTQAELDRWH